MEKYFQLSNIKWKISRITGVCCELIGGLILWMLAVMLARNAAGYPQANIPAGAMLLVGCGLLLIGISLSRLVKNNKE